jgi:hypothetical protein
MSICNRLLIIKLVLFWGGEVIGVVMVCEQGSAIGSVAGLRWGYVLRVILVSIWTLSCITTTTVNIGRKTSLERQLMGRFEPLTEEEIIKSSIRTALENGKAKYIDLQQGALNARRRQLFNRNELDDFKQAGCVGEGNLALLVNRPCTRYPEGLNRKALERLIHQENDDRNRLIDWAIDQDRVFTPGNRVEVVKLYHQMLLSRLKHGIWYQDDGGQWLHQSEVLK